MALLDWMKNRQQPVAQTPQEQKPETAKQMYTREAAQETQKPVKDLSAVDQAKVDKVRAVLDKATQHQGTSVGVSSPSDGATNAQPMRQNAMNQEKAAPALSPTSAQMGSPATEKGVPTSSKEPPAKAPEKPAPRTMPRRSPSWER